MVGFWFSNLHATCIVCMSHACLKELACLVENHCLSQITKFESCNLFRCQDNQVSTAMCGNTYIFGGSAFVLKSPNILFKFSVYAI